LDLEVKLLGFNDEEINELWIIIWKKSLMSFISQYYA
jgi:hypothetical protein